MQPVTGPETVQTKVGQPFNSTFPAWWTPPTNPNIIWGGGTTTENDGGTPYPPMTSVTVTATATIWHPTGQVQLTVGTMALPPQTLTNGSATFQFATPAVGTYPLSTSYTQTGGNFVSTPSSPSGVSLVVQQIPFNVAGTPTPGGPPVNGTITTGTPIYNGFDETLLGYNLGQENQDYYLVNLTAGSTYVITMASNFGLSWMSLQDPTGKQCAYCAYGNGFGSGAFPGQWGIGAQVTYKVPAGAGGTYTIVCMMPLWSWFGNGINPQTYSIQVLNPTNLSNATQIPAFALNYTTTSTITSGSYYGPAGSSYGAPNINGAGGSYPTTPPWVDFYQNWYTVPLSSGNTSYMIQLSMPAGGPSPILSIQDASGTQWAYNYTPGSTTATINFSPTSSGIYTIICAGDVAGAPGSPSPNGPPNAPAAPISYTLSFPGEALWRPTTTTVYPGVDLPGSPLNVTVKVTASGGAPPAALR